MNFDFLIGWLVSSIVYTIYLIMLRRSYSKEIEKHILRHKQLVQRIEELNEIIEENEITDYAELIEDKENEKGRGLNNGNG